MPGATISRWTMSYFALALVFLFASEMLLASGYAEPALPASPTTLAVIHGLAIGWLGLLFLGALLQFVPVLINKPLKASVLAFPALAAIAFGLALLMLGFISLENEGSRAPHLLAAAATVLSLGFALICGVIVATLWQAKPLPLTARFVLVGIVSLLLTVALGASFSLTLGGFAPDGPLVSLFMQAPPYHAYLGFAGWMTVTAFGVSYRLLAMFMLSPERERWTMRATCALAALAVAVAVLAAVLPPASAWPMSNILTGLSLILAALYLFDVIAILRERKRKTLELNSLASLLAVLSMPLAVAGSALAALTGTLDALAVPLAYLLVFGWLSGLGLAQLFKIVPFMTWMECYGPVLGRAAVPRVQDLVDERQAAVWFALYGASVLGATAALFIGSNAAFKLSTVIQLLALFGIALQFIRARSLAYVPAEVKCPAGIRLPHLFLPRPLCRRPQ